MRVAVYGAIWAALALIVGPADAASFSYRPCPSAADCTRALVQKTQATSPTTTTTTVTTHTITVNVGKLLDGMKQAASIAILHSKKSMSSGKVAKSSLLFVNAADAFRLKIIALQSAIATKNAATIAKANRDAAVAYATLVSTFRLVGIEDKTLTEAVRSITSSWASYASYFVLPQPKAALPANAMNLQGVGQTIDKIYEQLTVVETRTTTNKRVGRQIAYMKRRIDRHKKNGVTATTYRYAMSDLALVRGSDLALLAVANVYFTDLVSTLNAIDASFADTDSYWNAYYEGVYDAAMLQTMSGDISAPDDIGLNTNAIDKSEIDAAANDADVAKAVQNINDAPNDDAAPILTPDDGNDALDEPLPSETQFDCVAEGCGDTQAVNPTADTSQVDAAPPDNTNGSSATPTAPTDAAPPPPAADTTAPAPPEPAAPQDAGTSGKDATTPPADNAPPTPLTPPTDQNATPPAATTPAPSDAAPPSPDSAQPGAAQPDAAPPAPQGNSADPPPSDTAPADTSPPPANPQSPTEPTQPDAPSPDSGGN